MDAILETIMELRETTEHDLIVAFSPVLPAEAVLAAISQLAEAGLVNREGGRVWMS